MPDVPYPPEPEPTKPEEFYQALWGFGGAVGAVTRRVVTGDSQGRLRRKALFTIADLGVILTLVTDDVLGLVAGTLALVALLFLAMTDDVVSIIEEPQ